MDRRRGAAMVEFAVTLPVLVLVVMGTIECCAMIFMKQTLHIAAYEAARVALVPKTTTAQVNYSANTILANRRVRDATISISPSSFGTAPVSTYIEVTVSAPSNSNFAIPCLFFHGRVLSGSCAMMKEY